jgi:hypothetical protein
MSIVSREFRESDIKAIDDIYRRQPELGVPGLKNVIINSTLVDGNTGAIVGYGAVKIFAEAVLILDKSITKRDRAFAVKEAMHTALTFCRAKGLEMLYAIATNDKFGKVLENRYKFSKVPGELFCRVLKVDED